MGYSYTFNAKQRKLIQSELKEILYEWSYFVEDIVVLKNKICIFYTSNVTCEFIDNFDIYLLNYLDYPKYICKLSSINLD